MIFLWLLFGSIDGAATAVNTDINFIDVALRTTADLKTLTLFAEVEIILVFAGRGLSLTLLVRDKCLRAII